MTGLVKDLTLDMRDVHAGGGKVELKAGSAVFAPIWAVHRSPLNWPDRPNQFVPARFLGAKPASYRDRWIPFGGGRRICPGSILAPNEIKVVLAHLVRRFTFAPVPGGTPPEIHAHGMVQQALNNFVIVKEV